MPSQCPSRARRLLAACVLLAFHSTLFAAPRVDVLSVDLAPLIDRSAAIPSRFAVDVPHAVSPQTQGEWSAAGALSTWRYSVQIPTAVSMSFHASSVVFPENATLTVTANDVVYRYDAKDIRRGEIWSRIARGDSLSFELVLNTADVSRLRFDISSLQAGYRGLGRDTPNHRHYNALAAQSEAVVAASADCTENWACHTTAANTGPGQATVAIIVANREQCTGVLLNNVRNDGTPYVITARHCENGNPDGGSPGAASSMNVYWDSVAACGQPLGGIYQPGTRVQFGATTVVEQQDAWLVRLNDLPVADDAYYAGWDATGATFIGGFSPHHALGTTRQFIGWFGQASYNVVPGSKLDVHFESTLWATVNAIGAGGGGSSGGGLFDENGRLQGVIVRGYEKSSVTREGVCPLPSPPAPSLNSASTFSTALSGIFSSTTDPNSTTGATTIQSVLDPDHTGTKVMEGQTAPPAVTIRPDGNSTFTGQTIMLRWTSAHAQSCTASGGEPGDGWGGSIGTSGNQLVTSLDGGAVTYTVTCTDGHRSAVAKTDLTWTLSPPSVFFSADSALAYYNTPMRLSWGANLRPCVASGGHPGDGWSGTQPVNGVASVVETTLGAVTYRLTCGTGTRATISESTVTVQAPRAQLVADATTLRVGESAHLLATTVGLPCTLTGGAAGDGWAGSNTYNGTIVVPESTAGTYTYTISCGSGAQVATAQASVTFVNAAPSLSLTASTTSIDWGNVVTLTWNANVRPCLLSVSGPQSMTIDYASTAPQGTVQVSGDSLGDYTYTMACGSGATAVQHSITVSYTGTPLLNVFQGPSATVAKEQFLVQYQGNLAPCTFTGGGAGDGWAGTSSERNGNRRVTEPAAGTYTYIATCGLGALATQKQVTINVAESPPMVTVSSDPSFQVSGHPVTVTWSSNVSPCQLQGGSAGDGWTGSVASSGSKTVTEAGQGSFYYSVSCGTGYMSASYGTQVIFRTFAAPTLTANPTSVVVGENFTLTWASSDGSACTADAGGYTDGWIGNRDASGSISLRETATGSFIFRLTCGSSLTAQLTLPVTVSIPDPPLPADVQLSASANIVTVGNPVTLSWTTAHVDTCSLSGGSGDDGWSGYVSPGSGSKQIRETTNGAYSYGITCTGAGGATSASALADVTVNPTASVTVTGSNESSGGGGGALGRFELATLCAASALCWSRRRKPTLRYA